MHNYLFHKQQDQENYCYSVAVNTKTETFAFAGNKNAKHITEQIILIIIMAIITIIIIIGDNAARRQMATFKGEIKYSKSSECIIKGRTRRPPATFHPLGSKVNPLRGEAAPPSGRIINYQRTDLRHLVPARSLSFRSTRCPVPPTTHPPAINLNVKQAQPAQG